MAAVKPMLAHNKTPDIRTLTYPLIVQPKFDGIRALIVDGVVQSRSGKPIRNAEIQAALGRPEFNGLDGELLVGSPTAHDAMQRTSEFVMSASKTGAAWVFYVFDKYDAPGDYADRFMHVERVYAEHAGSLVRWTQFALVQSFTANSADDVNQFEAGLVAQGYEGAILRDPRAAYKHGRSGVKGPLLKVKRFSDDEAEVIGVVEQMTNTNEAKRDAFGRTERSTAKAGLVPAGTLGALRVRMLTGTWAGVEVEVGTGYNAAQRADLWALHTGATPLEHPPLVGRIIKVKHFEVGAKDAPRFPTFLSFRDPDDMDAPDADA